MLDRFFRFREQGTTLRTEVLGGVTTFVTMAYIIVVNPAVLAFAGIPTGPSTVATILAAVFGSLLMGLYANRPIAVAPYMGENAFIAFGLVTFGIGWEQRIGIVFYSGLGFLLITLFRVRSWLANSISPAMKHSFAVGIGLFLAFIGLYETGLVTSAAEGIPYEQLLVPGTNLLRAPAVPVKLGNLYEPRALLAVFGFLLTVTLLYRNVRGAMLLGIIVTAGLGSACGLGEAPERIAALPFRGEYDLGVIAFRLDLVSVLDLALLPVLLTLFLMSFLDTLGTLVGVGAVGGMLDEKGNFRDIEKPMVVDALACMFSALVGTSTSGAYIESATGIREGARTGFAAVVTAGLFAATLFFIPLVEPLQHLSYAYGPALIAVGILMVSSFSRMRFDDLTELVPAFTTIAIMVFTYNIGNGLTAGLVVYPILKVATGRAADLNLGSVVLGALCAVYYIFGVPH